MQSNSITATPAQSSSTATSPISNKVTTNKASAALATPNEVSAQNTVSSTSAPPANPPTARINEVGQTVGTRINTTA